MSSRQTARAVTGLVEKLSDPPSTLVTRGFFVFEPAIGHACVLTRPSERGEYELPDAIDLLLSAGHRVEAVELDGWCPTSANRATSTRLRTGSRDSSAAARRHSARTR